MSCTNLDNFWVGEKLFYYYIMVRNRNFDSVKLLEPGLAALKAAGASLDDLRIRVNEASCKN
jgi:hypothetical protein